MNNIIMAIRKNCNENGNRAELFGSNPHSNGEDCSRSSIRFLDNSVANIITISEIRMMI